MAILKGITTNQGQEVEENTKAARFVSRPVNVGSFGAFRIAMKSGAITGTGVDITDGLFSFRWSDATRVAVVQHVHAVLDVTTILTAAQEVGIDLAVIRSFSASDSGGTAATMTGHNGKLRTDFATSLVGDIRIASTAELTHGTGTADTMPLAMSNPVGDRVVNASAGTAYLPSPPQAVLDFRPNMAAGENPLVLETNEGFRVRWAAADMPAAGVVTLAVDVAWLELAAWP